MRAHIAGCGDDMRLGIERLVDESRPLREDREIGTEGRLARMVVQKLDPHAGHCRAAHVQLVHIRPKISMDRGIGYEDLVHMVEDHEIVVQFQHPHHPGHQMATPFVAHDRTECG